MNRKTASVSADRSSWLRIVEDIRTAIEQHPGYISLPKLTMAEMVY